MSRLNPARLARERVQIAAGLAALPGRAPRPVAVSTDFWTDVDDVTALRLLCWAERIGAIDIVACVLNTTLANGPGALDALLTAEGRPGVPIGVPATPYVPSGAPPYQTNMATNPRKLGYPATSPTAVSILRRALANAPAGGIEILELGYMTVLQELLQSAADAISPLTGLDLVAAKCARLWVMGGTMPNGGANNWTRDATARAAANYCMANWPATSPVTIIGHEVGTSIVAGGTLQYVLPPTDLVAKALVDHGSVNGRTCADPLAGLSFLYGSAQSGGACEEFSVVRGTVAVDAGTGANTWTNSASGPHEYVVKAMPDAWYKAIVERNLAPATQDAYVPRASGRVEAPLLLARTQLGRAQPALPERVSAGVDNANLIGWWHAADLATLADAAAVLFWEDRKGRYPLVGAGASAPTFAAAKNGKSAVAFNGSQHLVAADHARVSRLITLYVKLQVDVAPAADQYVMDFEDTTAVDTKVLQLQIASGQAAKAVHFQHQGSTVIDLAGQGAIGTAAWHVVSLVRQENSIEALYDNLSNGSSTLGGFAWPTLAAPITVGRRASSVNGLVGWIHEIRMYAAAHDAATRAAVIAEMD